MYNVYNPFDTFYEWNIKREQIFLIGNEKDFIKYLADDYYSSYYQGYGEKFSNRYFSRFVCCQNDYTPDKEFQFFRGDACINPKDWEEEAYALYEKEKKDKDYYKYWKKNKVYKGSFRQGPVEGIHKYRGGSGHRPPKTKHIFAMYDNPEYKEYNRGTKKIIPKWQDDKFRHVEMNWKSQRKTRHQWKE